jgi:hypothetical protein
MFCRNLMTGEPHCREIAAITTTIRKSSVVATNGLEINAEQPELPV